MNIEDITKICKTLPAVKTDIKWEDHLCFTIGEKMFFIVSLENVPTSASFKTTAEEFDHFRSQEGFKSAPYLGRYKWIHVDDLNRLPAKEWENIIKTSYQLIVEKLPKKIQKELNLK